MCVFVRGCDNTLYKDRIARARAHTHTHKHTHTHVHTHKREKLVD